MAFFEEKTERPGNKVKESTNVSVDHENNDKKKDEDRPPECVFIFGHFFLDGAQ